MKGAEQRGGPRIRAAPWLNLKSSNCCSARLGNQPSVGEYYTEQQSIQYKIQKQKQFIDNLKKIDVTKPGFESSKPRFPHYDNQLSSQAEQNNNNNQSFSYDKPNLSISYQQQDHSFRNGASSKVQDRRRFKSQDQPNVPFLTNVNCLDPSFTASERGRARLSCLLIAWLLFPESTKLCSDSFCVPAGRPHLYFSRLLLLLRQNCC